MGHLEDVVHRAMVIREISACGDTDVIHINSYGGSERLVFEDDIAVYEVHHCLEGGWGIGESEIHHRRFEEPVSGFKGCFVFVAFANAYVVVSPPYVEFGINVRIAQVAYEIRDKGKRVLIPDSDGVNLLVVLDRAEFPILFANEEKG